MVKNKKAIDGNIIPETNLDKQEMFKDMFKISRGEKDGFTHKIFHDMASLDGVKPAEKIQAAIHILTMKGDEKMTLLTNFNNVSDSAGAKIKGAGKLDPEISSAITSQNDTLLATILPKFGNNLREVLANPDQKLNPAKQKPQTLPDRALKRRESFTQRLAASNSPRTR